MGDMVLQFKGKCECEEQHTSFCTVFSTHVVVLLAAVLPEHTAHSSCYL